MMFFKRNKSKFNVIFDLDGTLIKAKSDNKYPQDSKDWQFKPHMLEVLLSIYTNGGTIGIFHSYVGVTFGYLTPIESNKILYKVVENILEFIENETGDSYKKIIRRINLHTIMGYNNPLRKGAYYDEEDIKFMRSVFKMDNKINMFIGDGSGINVEIATKQPINNIAAMKTFTNCTTNLFNSRLQNINLQLFRISSTFKTDITTAKNLGCDIYLDEGLFIKNYNFERYDNLFNNLNLCVPHFDNLCPNMIDDDYELDFECGFISNITKYSKEG